MNTIKNDYNQTKYASELEEIICLAIHINNGKLPYNATIEDSNSIFNGQYQGECLNCPYTEKCLACSINE